jgi:hypothetical protein
MVAKVRNARGRKETQGYLYAWYDPTMPGFCNVGMSENVKCRLDRTREKCKREVIKVQDPNDRKIKRVSHAETIVKAMMAPYRYQQYCHGCGTWHVEWFRLTPEDVVMYLDTVRNLQERELGECGAEEYPRSSWELSLRGRERNVIIAILVILIFHIISSTHRQ